ncbi:MAG TPA: EVE domain-containing protein [Steroidobacter sp.]|nr:EVE domain-containing protein [Steroidobacter sp.]
MNYWLMKSEPATFGVDDLARARKRTSGWDGVRNYQARNFMRSMKRSDLAFFYHSSCAVPGVVGVMSIVREAYPDPTAFDPADDHYDPHSTSSKPRWFMVDVQLERKFDRIVTLDELRSHGDGALQGMSVLKRGNRLSITPVIKAHWDFIMKLAQTAAADNREAASRTRRTSTAR